MNVAYCWFLGYLMNEPIPHFSTISYNFKHIYTERTIQGIFYWILNEIETVVADVGYKTPWISKRVLDDGRIPVFPYKRPIEKKGNYSPYEYVYDECFDCVACPENQVLSYTATNREGYREFKSKGYICEKCPTKHLCAENSKNEKTVTKHVWLDYLEMVEDIRYMPEYKELYR